MSTTDKDFLQNTFDPHDGGAANLERFVNDPAYRKELAEKLAVSYMLPEEVEKSDIPLSDIFAAAKLPPENNVRPQAALGAGPSLGQTAAPVPVQQNLYAQNFQGPRAPSLGSLIGGR